MFYEPLPPDLMARVVLSRPPLPGSPGDVIGMVGQDPFRADPAQLRAAGLPMRPDPVATPRLFAFWRRMVQLPLERLGQPALGLDRTAGHPLGSVDTGQVAGRLATRWGTSRNWSGAVIQARDGKLFTSVAGSWIVPEAEGVEGDAAAALPGGNRQCSVWIGLDGHRRYSQSLPQVGTRSLARPLGNGGSASEYHLWVQWWARDELFGEVPVTNFPVKAGHEIMAKLDVLGPTEVYFSVVNRSTGLCLGATWHAGERQGVIEGTLQVVQQPMAALVREKTPVEGRHAVWCVERPSVLPDPNLPRAAALEAIRPYDLPVFGAAAFTEALAEMRDPDRSAVPAEERDLTAARRIRMIDTVPADVAPPATRRMASPSGPGMDGRPDAGPLLRVEQFGL